MNTTLRSTLKTIDHRLFAGTIKKLNRYRWRYQSSWLRYQSTKKMQAQFKCNNIYYTRKQQNYLGQLFDKHGSDKGYYLHNNKDGISGCNYNDIYELLFF